MPFIDDVTSLVSVNHLKGTEEGLISKDLIEIWPPSPEDIPEFKDEVISNPNYVGNIISKDGKFANIVVLLERFSQKSLNNNSMDDILGGFSDNAGMDDEQLELLSGEEETEFVESILRLVENYKLENANLFIAGDRVVTYQLSHDMSNMITKNMVFGMLVVAVLLWVLFQRVSGVILPLIVVIASITTTIALMPVFGVPMTATNKVLPTFLLAIGIADTVHILSIFYREYDRSGEKNQAITFAVGKTATAILMTTVTTAAGLLSFSFADLEPTRMLGIFGAVGVFIALILTLTIVPPLLALTKVKQKDTTTKKV